MSLEAIAARGLVLLGCGKMGAALLEGWLAGGAPPSAFTVIEPHPGDRLRALEAEGLSLADAPPAQAGTVVVAVKPQAMATALPRVAPLGGGGALFLSIAAGVPIRSFEEALGPATPVVRAMPNTPAAIGRGIAALVGNAVAGPEGIAAAETLLASVGETVRLDDEAQMDAVTAVSGSGPAYVFLMIEALAAAGEAEGLAPDLAMALARATVSGAGRLAEASDEAPAQLRINVTSPGGTTAAALEALMAEEDGLPALMRRAVAAAARRSRELGA